MSHYLQSLLIGNIGNIFLNFKVDESSQIAIEMSQSKQQADKLVVQVDGTMDLVHTGANGAEKVLAQDLMLTLQSGRGVKERVSLPAERTLKITEMSETQLNAKILEKLSASESSKIGTLPSGPLKRALLEQLSPGSSLVFKKDTAFGDVSNHRIKYEVSHLETDKALSLLGPDNVLSMVEEKYKVINDI